MKFSIKNFFKNKFYVKDFISKSDQIRSFLRILSR